MDKDELLNIDCYLLLSNMQFYIVSGGHPKGSWGQPGNMDSTEILKKEGGASWQPAASLPTSRFGLRGVSLPNGHFMVSGEDYLTCFMAPYDASLQAATAPRRTRRTIHRED